MSVKLIQVCRELNIGMGELVPYCKKQGIRIHTDNPNHRLSDDEYLRIVQAFNAPKEESVEIAPAVVELEEQEAIEPTPERIKKTESDEKSIESPVLEKKPNLDEDTGYHNFTVTTNINIDVLNAIQSGNYNIDRILAVALAPITRTNEWPNSTWNKHVIPLYDIVRERCHAHPEYRWLPYDQLITELTNWMKKKDSDWKEQYVSCIAVIKRYDIKGLVLNIPVVESYCKIRDRGSYEKINYETSGEYFYYKKHDGVKKQISKRTIREMTFWIVMCSSYDIESAFAQKCLPELEMRHLMSDKGNDIQIKPKTGDYVVLQNTDTEELCGVGYLHFYDEELEKIDWLYIGIIETIYQPLVGDEVFKPYLLTNGGRIRTIKALVELK